eukprot:TRINITY_DN14748_c0_g1_i1.p2 TRINITY_DN14748_c0_g1~~TRINITY_DN14748_c0_g1_i1.p2  ORF type:complete len:105 (+),score=11.78 TRINITY_DN14748_c0_g1_i1:223-537(+)
MGEPQPPVVIGREDMHCHAQQLHRQVQHLHISEPPRGAVRLPPFLHPQVYSFRMSSDQKAYVFELDATSSTRGRMTSLRRAAADFFFHSSAATDGWAQALTKDV